MEGEKKQNKEITYFNLLFADVAFFLLAEFKLYP